MLVKFTADVAANRKTLATSSERSTRVLRPADNASACCFGVCSSTELWIFPSEAGREARCERRVEGGEDVGVIINSSERKNRAVDESDVTRTDGDDPSSAAVFTHNTRK